MAERTPILTTVRDVSWLTPRMARIVLAGDGLAGFGAGAFTDHYVKLLFPPAGAPYTAPFDPAAIKAELPREQWPRTRTYTVRAWDAERRRLTIDFVVHGDSGIAGPWAATARPGDRLQLFGPGGAYAPDPAADWHLMVGDPSVLPAIGASLARVPAGVPVIVVAEVDSSEDEIALATLGALDLRWVRTGMLLDAVRALRLPPGRGQCFVHGEATAVREVRRHLLAERGVDREDLSVSGYWKRTRTEEGWRDDKAEWARQAELDLAGATG
jgi:NADPH-dependent ferric siderophore reductase